MDFNFTDEQAMLRESLARTLQKTYDFDRRKAIVASGRGMSPEVWRQLIAAGMTQDWSWAHSAKDYVELYRKTIERSAVAHASM